MMGERMLYFVPLHMGAIESQTGLFSWIGSCCNENNLEVLAPEDWYVRGHGITGYTKNCDLVAIPLLKSGSFICAPPRWPHEMPCKN